MISTMVAATRKSTTRTRRSGVTAWPSAAGRCPSGPRNTAVAAWIKEQLKVLRQEMARISARRPLDSFGISMLGPALLHFGSEEQKLEHLPKIVRGEIRWCQGYSEPNAGSDLASLATKAEDKGDHYLINGQKDLDLLRRQVRLDFLPGAHRQQRHQARGHQLCAVRHGPARCHCPAHQVDQR